MGCKGLPKKVAIADSTYIGGDLRPYTEFDIPSPHCAKYRRFGNDSGNNYAVYRFAEVYLIAAEALNEISGPSGEAIGYVNVVRERARNWNGTMTSFPADITSGVSKEEFLGLILEERRFELSFELKRWWDIKRRNMGAKIFATDGLPQPAFTDAKYLLGLPQDELDRNPNLKPQNPSY